MGYEFASSSQREGLRGKMRDDQDGAEKRS